LVFAGRIQPLKGPDVALRAAASLLRLAPALAERLVVVFVGGPSGSEVGAPGRLSALASSLGVAGHVRFEPPCTQRELADWYRAATMVLVPSHSESFGLVALEAQACGTPVVAAAVGGLRSIVRHGQTGFLVQPGASAAFAERVWRVLSDPPLATTMGRLAVCSSGDFSWDRSDRKSTTSELQSHLNLVCRLLLEKKKAVQEGAEWTSAKDHRYCGRM